MCWLPRSSAQCLSLVPTAVSILLASVRPRQNSVAAFKHPSNPMGFCTTRHGLGFRSWGRAAPMRHPMTFALCTGSATDPPRRLRLPVGRCWRAPSCCLTGSLVPREREGVLSGCWSHPGGRRDGAIEYADGTVAFAPIRNRNIDEVRAHIGRETLPVGLQHARRPPSADRPVHLAADRRRPGHGKHGRRYARNWPTHCPTSGQRT